MHNIIMNEELGVLMQHKITFMCSFIKLTKCNADGKLIEILIRNQEIYKEISWEANKLYLTQQ